MNARAFVAVGLMVCAACAPHRAPSPDDRPEFGAMTPVATHPPLDGVQRPGLLTMRWSVPEAGFELDRTLATFEPCPDLSPEDHARLARSGLIVVRIPEAELQHAVDVMGGSYSDVRTWHEQATSWRDCLRQSTRARRVLVDGGIALLESSDIRLLLRGWAMPTHDGAVVTVEFTPAEPAPRSERMPLSLQPSLVEDLGREFRSASASWTLRKGYIDLVTSCAPSGLTGVGPATELPLTIGEALFAPDLDSDATRPVATPRRTLLLLVPSLPDSLFPTPAGVASPAPAEPTP